MSNSFDFVRDQDKEIVIKVNAKRATRAAFQLPANVKTENVILSQKLLQFPGISVFRSPTKGTRISFKTNPEYSYAYYKITPRLLSIATGLGIATIAASLAATVISPYIASAIGATTFVSGAAVAFITKAVTIGIGATAGIIAAYLVNKSYPKYVLSEDPNVSLFYQEIVIYNQKIYQDQSQLYAFWSVDDGDPKDLYRIFKVANSIVDKLPEAANNALDAGNKTLGIFSDLIQFMPLVLISFLGFKIYDSYKEKK